MSALRTRLFSGHDQAIEETTTTFKLTHQFKMRLVDSFLTGNWIERLLKIVAPAHDECDESDMYAALLTLVSIDFVKHHVKWALFFQRLIWVYDLDVDASVGCPCQEGALQMLLRLNDGKTFPYLKS